MSDLEPKTTAVIDEIATKHGYKSPGSVLAMAMCAVQADQSYSQYLVLCEDQDQPACMLHEYQTLKDEFGAMKAVAQADHDKALEINSHGVSYDAGIVDYD